MSNRAWMPLHISDYLADTGHLTAAEHGAYLMLIMHYWQNGSLPQNEKLIARIARMTAEQWEESRDVIAMLFGENWTHKRIDEELAKADDIIEKRRNAALAKRTVSKCSANAEQVTSNSSDTGALPLTSNLSSSSLRSEEDAQGAPEAKSVPKPKELTPFEELAKVLDVEHARAVVKHREKLRKPMTAHAAKLLAGRFAQWRDPNGGADAMIENGWTGFEPVWMENREKRGAEAQAPPRQRTILDAIDDFVGHSNEQFITIDHDGEHLETNVHRLASAERYRG